MTDLTKFVIYIAGMILAIALSIWLNYFVGVPAG